MFRAAEIPACCRNGGVQGHEDGDGNVATDFADSNGNEEVLGTYLGTRHSCCLPFLQDEIPMPLASIAARPCELQSVDHRSR